MLVATCESVAGLFAAAAGVTAVARVSAAMAVVLTSLFSGTFSPTSYAGSLTMGLMLHFSLVCCLYRSPALSIVNDNCGIERSGDTDVFFYCNIS